MDKGQNGSAEEHAPLEHILIVGGGSAGWMTAAALVNAIGDSARITLVESEDIGIVGVGEATIPPIKVFNQRLGIDEATFVKETQGSFKLGIQFNNWGQLGESYFHPFGTYGVDFDMVPLHYYWLQEHLSGSDVKLDDHCMAWGLAAQDRFTAPRKEPNNVLSTFDYAYHFDAVLYGQFLRRYATERGVVRREGRICDTTLHGQTGHIASVTLEDGETISADFFVDCSGFRGLLIEGALKTGYEAWTQWLPCDRAVAIPCTRQEPLHPYTKATARDAGWQWRIPLQHRTGNGYVYCSDFINQDAATSDLLSRLDGEATADPRPLRFTTGHRNKFWHRNCVAIGLAAGFMEPLESTSLHLVQTGIMRLLALLPGRDMHPALAAEYNRLTTNEYERIRDFLVLHYKATRRDDTPLWRYCQHMDIPDSLAAKIEQFRENGHIVAEELELFRNASWLAVYIGQGIIPKRTAPLAMMRDHVPAADRLSNLRDVIAKTAEQLPTHDAFIQRHCASPVRS